MKTKSQLALSTAALVASVLVVGLGVFGGAAPPPAQATAVEISALPSPSPAPVAERPVDGLLSATGMEHVPVFD